MILDNRSSHSEAELKSLSQFVVQFFKSHKDCRVVVRDEESFGGVGHGVCYGHRKLVEVYIPRGTTYPIAAQHRKRTGGTLYRCWQDVFVAILAHELRHNDQFHTDGNWAHTPQKEVDAEQYAQKVLAERRKAITPVDTRVRV